MDTLNDDSDVVQAFENNVPEVAAGVVEIVRIARNKGQQLMVAVRSHARNVDPVSMCVGPGGRRARGICAELHGEKLFLVLWSESVIDFIHSAIFAGHLGRYISPEVVLNPATHQARVKVDWEIMQHMNARNGLLLELASRLVGWDIKLLPIDIA